MDKPEVEVDNVAEFFKSCAAHVERALKREEFEKAYRICRDLLPMPDLPLYYRGAFNLILASSGKDALFHAHKALDTFKIVVERLHGNKEAPSLIVLCNLVIEEVERQEARKYMPSRETTVNYSLFRQQWQSGEHTNKGLAEQIRKHVEETAAFLSSESESVTSTGAQHSQDGPNLEEEKK